MQNLVALSALIRATPRLKDLSSSICNLSNDRDLTAACSNRGIP